MPDQKQNAPDTLPADFFAQKQPETLPANFSFPKGNQPATLPNVSNRQITKGITSALPWIGGTAGMLLAPEVELAGIGGWLLNAAIGGASAAAGGGAGATASEGIKAATNAPDKAKSFKEGAIRVGKEAAAQGAGEIGGRAIMAPFSFALRRFTPKGLYSSALKAGGKGMGEAEQRAIVETGLKNRIPLGETGYGQLAKSVNELSNEINARVASKSPQLGEVISPKRVMDRLDALIEHYRKQGFPDEDIAQIQKVRDSFMNRHSYEAPQTLMKPGSAWQQKIHRALRPNATGPLVPVGQKTTRVLQDMTLAEAQAEKQGTYRFNKDAYGRLSGAQVEAEKNLAHTLREQITALFPEINVLNGKDKSLIDLKEQVEKFVVRERRRNMLPAAVAVAGASTGILTGAFSGDAAKGGESGVGAALLTMTMLAMDDPEIKSKLAIALYRAGKNRIGSAVAKTAKEVLPGAARAVGSSVANPSPRGTLTPPPK